MKRLISHILTFSAAVAVGITGAWLNQETQELEIAGGTEPAQIVIEKTPTVSFTVDADDAEEIVEFFSDESRIGRPGKNKVEIKCFDRGEIRIAQITFYSRLTSGDWVQKQSFEFQKDDLTDCDPNVKDFNNDGLRELTYVSDVAARGANEVRTLFIYDEKKDELVHIKNSDQFPNLKYNPKLKCLDAWLFHGSTTTIFLRLEGDELKEFASVDTGLQLIVTVTDKSGNEKVIRREDMNEDDVYTRYLTFDPPRPNNAPSN